MRCAKSSSARRIVKRAAQAAGLTKPVSAHWPRHSQVSHALARNASTVAVQAQVGHASLAIISGYAHADRYSADYLVV